MTKLASVGTINGFPEWKSGYPRTGASVSSYFIDSVAFKASFVRSMGTFFVFYEFPFEGSFKAGITANWL